MHATRLHALDALNDLHIQAQVAQQLQRVLSLGYILREADQVRLGRRLRVPPTFLLAPAEGLPCLQAPDQARFMSVARQTRGGSRGSRVPIALISELRSREQAPACAGRMPEHGCARGAVPIEMASCF